MKEGDNLNCKIQTGCYGDIWTWISDMDIHNKLFRVWYINRNRPQKSDRTFVYMDDYYEESTCEHRYFTEFIELPNGDFLIGMQSEDEDREGRKYPCIEYRKLSDIHFSYYECDNEPPEEEDDD